MKSLLLNKKCNCQSLRPSATMTIWPTTRRARNHVKRSKCTFSLESKCCATLRTSSLTTRPSCAETLWKLVYVSSMMIVLMPMDMENSLLSHHHSALTRTIRLKCASSGMSRRPDCALMETNANSSMMRILMKYIL